MAKEYTDNHRLLLIQNGKERDITDMCGDMQLDDELNAVSVTLSFSVFTAPYDKYATNLQIKPGDKVRLVNHDKEVFFGWILTVSLDGSVFARDKGWYLSTNEILLQCNEAPADSVIRQLAVKAGVNPGEIAPLKTPISGLWMGDAASEILQEILEACTRETGKQYQFRIEEEHLQVRELAQEPITVYHKPAENVGAFNITWALGAIAGDSDISNLKNVVLIAAEDDGKVYVAAQASNQESMKKYGFLQKIETVTEDEGKARQEQQAKTLLEQYDRVTHTRSIEDVWGADEVISGVVLNFNSPYSGLAGLYRVTHVTHYYEGAGHRMTLEVLALEQPRAVPGAKDKVVADGLPQDFGKSKVSAEEVAGDSSYTDSGYEIVGGRKVNARFSAYYPANNAMEGGFKDALGNWLVPANHTCAAPPSVPFGTKITVTGTGTSRDGVTYTVTDRGGAIKIKNGVYWIDLLMSSNSECNAFGVHYGTAIIGGTQQAKAQSTASGSVSSGATAFVKIAAGEIGYHEGYKNDNKYGAWAGNNHQPWCCYFVGWCSSKSGAPIPKTFGAVADMERYYRKRGLFHSVSSGYIPKAGDLMIQSGKHIGIVEWADSSAVHTIEGNCSNSVKRMTRSYGEISGFCTPWAA